MFPMTLLPTLWLRHVGDRGEQSEAIGEEKRNRGDRCCVSKAALLHSGGTQVLPHTPCSLQAFGLLTRGHPPMWATLGGSERSEYFHNNTKRFALLTVTRERTVWLPRGVASCTLALLLPRAILWAEGIYSVTSSLAQAASSPGSSTGLLFSS